MEQVVDVDALCIKIKTAQFVKGSFIFKLNLNASLKLITIIYFRQILLCRVCLGKSHFQLASSKLAHAPPGHHSVCGRPSQGGLVYPEYVVYRGEQVKFNNFQ